MSGDGVPPPRRDPRQQRDRLRRTPASDLRGPTPTGKVPAETEQAAHLTPAHARPVRRDPRAERGRERTGSRSAPASAAKTAPDIVRLEAPNHWVLVVPDAPGGSLCAHDRDALAAARLLADAGRGGVIALAPAAGPFYGALGVDRLALLPPAGWESRLAAVEHLLADFAPAHVIVPDTPLGGGHLGRTLAARLGLAVATGVVRISGGELVRRADGGRREQILSPPPIILVAPEVVPPRAGPPREARLVALPPITIEPTAVEDRGTLPIDPMSMPLDEADFIISAGVGVSDWTSFADLARVLDAAIGCTRAVCDRGDLPRDRQVGASGTLVNPRCYLSFGISGAPQHLQGIARCERVVAVNTDLHAEMIKRADLAIVADAQEVMPALLSLLRRRR